MRFFVWLIICCCFFIFLFPTVGQSEEVLSTSAQHAILMEETTGRTLYEKDAHEKRPIASITKVMTAMVALQYGDLDDMVTISKDAAYTNGSSIYLEEDEKMRLEDLLYGLMLRSGNDAAVSIAEHIGGSEEGFALLMNETAAYIGMTNTHFMNSHGLDEDGHYSSAYDMALLMRYAMGNDMFEKISGTTSYQAKSRTYPWNNKNKLLTQIYEPSTGGKTGFTQKAGRTLVTTAEKGKLSLIAVTLNAPDDWNDHMSLYEWAFDHFKLKKIEAKGKRTFQLENDKRTGFIENNIFYPLHHDEENELRKEAILVKNPAEESEKLGDIQFIINDQPMMDIPVYQYRQVSYPEMLKKMLLLILRNDSNG